MGHAESDRPRLRCLMAGISRWNPVVLNWSHAVSQFADVYGLSLSGGHPPGWEKISDRAAIGALEGIPTVSIRMSHLKPTRLFWRVNASRDSKSILESLARWGIPKLDVIHGHWYASSPALVRTARSLGAHYIHTEHFSGLVKGNGMSSGGELMLRDLAMKAAGVIAVGDEVASALQNRGLAPVVIPNPVRVPDSTITGVPERDEPVRLISVARLVADKRLDLLVEALARVLADPQRDVRLMIVGRGPERERLEQTISRLGLSDVVELTGWMSPDDVMAALARSHVYVHTSSIETFSVALVEAMMLGLPVVVAKAGGVTEQVQPWMGQVVASSRPGEFAEAISFVISAIESFDREAIAAWAKTHFGIDAVARELEIFYKTVLTG